MARQTILFSLCLFVLGCELESGESGSSKDFLFEGGGSVTENGTNFVAPWAPGDFWRYGAKGSCYRTGFHVYKDRFCVDINFEDGGDSDMGMPFFAIFDGIVVENRQQLDSDGKGYGWLITVETVDGNYRMRIAHNMQKPLVEVGEYVEKGQLISYCGNSGTVQAHGHYCVYSSDAPRSDCSQVWCSIPFATIDGVVYDDDLCKISYTNIQSSNDFAFQRVEQEFGGSVALGAVIDETNGYRGIHWYYPFNNSVGNVLGAIDYNTCLIQDWYNQNQNKRSAIVYDVLLGARRAYLVHSGFAADSQNGWLQDSNGTNTSGPKSKLGMPISNEFTDHGTTFQNFRHGYLTWRSGASIEYHNYPNACPGCVSSVLSASDNLLVKVQNSLGSSVWWSKRFSYLFADAYNRSINNGNWLGFANNAVKNVNGYYVQHFTNATRNYLQGSAIIYDPTNTKSTYFVDKKLGGEHKAYVVRSGFWQAYNSVLLNGNTAFEYCGAPVIDEMIGLPLEFKNKVTFWSDIDAFQLFERCFMVWNVNENIAVCTGNEQNAECYHLEDNGSGGYSVYEIRVVDPADQIQNGQGGTSTEFGFCGDLLAYNLYCWASPACEDYGSGYWSPAVWSPNYPQEAPPLCGANDLPDKYPAGWECCCGNIVDWVPNGNRNCVEGTWLILGTDSLDNTDTAINNNSICNESCPDESVFMCWDNNSCYNYGNGYGSPVVWASDCYTDIPPACGRWVDGLDKYPTNWQCCCGYEQDWQNGDRTCLSSAFSVP